MKPTPLSQEWHRLFIAKAEGTITGEDHQGLCELLKDSAEARSYWYLFNDIEAGLHDWAQWEGQRASEAPSLSLPKRARQTAESHGWKSFAMSAAAVFLMGVVIGFIWLRTVPASSPSGSVKASRGEAVTSTVAVLTRGVNLSWASPGLAPALNAPLTPGWLHLRSGLAEIEFFQGARLLVEGPADLQLISDREAFCSRGRLTAQVPAQARGFRLNTPKGDIVDLGTEFGLNLDGAQPELHVFKGEVELHQQQKEKQLFIEGQAVGLEASRKFAANVAGFSFSRDLESKVQNSEREDFQRWQDLGNEWNADPALRLRLDFQDATGSRLLRNRASHGMDLSPGAIVGCTWIPGRWAGKQALQFRSVSDRVRLNIPGEYRELTFSTWVQLHSLNPGRSSLFMCEGFSPGAVHWQVLHDGSICLGIAGPKRTVADDYISPIVFTPERLGQWIHLAVTYDTLRGEVRHYVNGQCISRHPMNLHSILSPGFAELGNWNPAPEWKLRPVRNLVGCMDEFSLYSRALSDDEIFHLASEK